MFLDELDVDVLSWKDFESPFLTRFSLVPWESVNCLCF